MKNTRIILILGLAITTGAMIVGCRTNGNDSSHEGHNHASHSDEMTESTTSLATTEDTSEIKPYLLEKCLVSGEELSSMGEPTVIIYKGQESKLCCNDCVKGFNKEPEKYLAALNSGKVLEEKVHDHSSH
jgi:hypothetical protein